MTQPVTALVPVTLADGISEADFLAASARFQTDFVDQQPGVLRRELLRTADRAYLDIVQFISTQAMEEVMVLEKESAACQAMFALIEPAGIAESDIAVYPSLATYR